MHAQSLGEVAWGPAGARCGVGGAWSRGHVMDHLHDYRLLVLVIQHPAFQRFQAASSKHVSSTRRTPGVPINRTPISPPLIHTKSGIGPFFAAPAFASICKQPPGV